MFRTSRITYSEQEVSTALKSLENKTNCSSFVKEAAKYQFADESEHSLRLVSEIVSLVQQNLFYWLNLTEDRITLWFQEDQQAEIDRLQSEYIVYSKTINAFTSVDEETLKRLRDAIDWFTPYIQDKQGCLTNVREVLSSVFGSQFQANAKYFLAAAKQDLKEIQEGSSIAQKQEYSLNINGLRNFVGSVFIDEKAICNAIDQYDNEYSRDALEEIIVFLEGQKERTDIGEDDYLESLKLPVEKCKEIISNQAQQIQEGIQKIGNPERKDLQEKAFEILTQKYAAEPIDREAARVLTIQSLFQQLFNADCTPDDEETSGEESIQIVHITTRAERFTCIATENSDLIDGINQVACVINRRLPLSYIEGEKIEALYSEKAISQIDQIWSDWKYLQLPVLVVKTIGAWIGMVFKYFVGRDWTGNHWHLQAQNFTCSDDVEQARVRKEIGLFSRGYDLIEGGKTSEFYGWVKEAAKHYNEGSDADIQVDKMQLIQEILQPNPKIPFNTYALLQFTGRDKLTEEEIFATREWIAGNIEPVNTAMQNLRDLFAGSCFYLRPAPKPDLEAFAAAVKGLYDAYKNFERAFGAFAVADFTED